MRWPSFWSSSSSEKNRDNQQQEDTNISHITRNVLDKPLSTTTSFRTTPSPSDSRKPVDWSSFLTTSFYQLFNAKENIVPTAILTGTCLAFYAFYRSYLRRIPAAGNISPGFFRKRSLIGRVTSVGDGDNFRIFHTPGGRLAGWGWLPWRRVPNERKELKDKTVNEISQEVCNACSWLMWMTDSYPTCWSRRARACSFRKTIATIFAGCARVVEVLCSQSTSTGICLQEGPVRSHCRNCLRLEGGDSARRGVSDAQGRFSDSL